MPQNAVSMWCLVCFNNDFKRTIINIVMFLQCCCAVGPAGVVLALRGAGGRTQLNVNLSAVWCFLLKQGT